MRYFDSTKSIELHVDASAVRLCAILTQTGYEEMIQALLRMPADL